MIKDGYHVSVVQEPLSSLNDDVAATQRVIALQEGPCILVSHSYGGTVITEAGTASNVAGLVYIASHEPDTGETEAGNGKPYPTPLSKAQAIQKTPDGFTSLGRDSYTEWLAPLTSTTWLWARAAYMRSRSGLMISSASATSGRGAD